MARLHGVVAIAVCTLFIAACQGGEPAQPPPAETVTPTTGLGLDDRKITLDFGGKQRSYLVHLPPGHDGTTAVPLVVVMHYFPGDAAGIATTSQWNAKADKENFIVVYPEGYSSAFNALICCGSEDDVGFIRTVVGQVVDEWKIDRKRVYATGMSNGGDMSFKLAVELPGTFAAIAPVSGGFIGPAAADPAYRPARPVSVITFLGGKDRYYGQFDAGIAQWQQRLACAPDGPPQQRTHGITVSTARCGDGSDVAVYRLPDMGHAWPGGARSSHSDPEAGVNATDLAWDFFQAHPAA
ncbi:polyhydroxybutyrate depolymerase [Nocardia sp. CDC159]|uniref:Polyhydroxybutyrate depolymerase n=1 Tax=Nocardia pulmonis TaxID=2951408 RepID=A0A9X2EF66_9NOCA|nr:MULTISPECIES: PHB depolymerase family esterase [Nocardia]MCM6778335.1 polyhydroxybutyrate depolymerase [Nocardia pulmonis]MCM6791269.1 polyhydroxybutyrate depolymerase [Nocardia sp. CDC159]